MAKTAKIRLFIDADIAPGAAIPLGREQTHYVANVMRAKVGDEIAIFNGRDGGWSAGIVEVAKRLVVIEPKEQLKAQSQDNDLWLLFAPIKKGRLDYMVQKATEMGVSKLIPVKTDRTNVERIKEERMVANAIEAAEQSERLSVPEVGEMTTLVSLLKEWPVDRRLLFCDEDAGGGNAHEVLGAYEPDLPWAVLIGPEGGFTDAERDTIKALPQTTVISLGPRILRADTAAIVALTLWQTTLGDW